MNIVLIGYRGTGKSAVARQLAERTGRTILSIDAEIVRRIGCSIPEYVERMGWDAFRDVEAAIAVEAGARDGIIIDAGGGVVTRRANVDALRANGCVIWLTADPDTIVSRIEGDTNRPSLTHSKSFVDEVGEVLAMRLPLYAAAAHYEVSTHDRTPAQVADAILAVTSNTQS